MNALELADELEGFGYLNSDDGLHFCPFQAQVDMLRQQQAEIEALKAEATKLVMAEHCTCYKLGYSPLNDYASVK
jgi:hypothetical protein